MAPYILSRLLVSEGHVVVSIEGALRDYGFSFVSSDDAHAVPVFRAVSGSLHEQKSYVRVESLRDLESVARGGALSILEHIPSSTRQLAQLSDGNVLALPHVFYYYFLIHIVVASRMSIFL